jgi:syntaxin 1B/2/3
MTLQGCGHGSSSERARTAVTGALRRKLAALMADFQQLRSRIQAEYRSGH